MHFLDIIQFIKTFRQRVNDNPLRPRSLFQGDLSQHDSCNNNSPNVYVEVENKRSQYNHKQKTDLNLSIGDPEKHIENACLDGQRERL